LAAPRLQLIQVLDLRESFMCDENYSVLAALFPIRANLLRKSDQLMC
jgi:hypothetical protein